jgi:hypothetical protein
MGTYYRSEWAVLEDGGSDRWLYFRSDGTTSCFISVEDFVRCLGREADHAISCTGRVVVVRETPLRTLEEAWKFCDGKSWRPPESEAQANMLLSHMLLDYGSAGVVFDRVGLPVNGRDPWDVTFDENHRVFQKLRTQARRALEPFLSASVEERNDLLECKRNNAVGDTALDFVRARSDGEDGWKGSLLDLWSCLCGEKTWGSEAKSA